MANRYRRPRAQIAAVPASPYPLRRRISRRSRPQKAMRIRAKVLTPSNNTITSSMLESLRWCRESMRACREIVIIQLRKMPGRNHFSGTTKTSGNKERPIWLITKQGRPTCSSSSISSGTNRATDSSPRSVSGRLSDDRAVCNNPWLDQCRHFRGTCAGCLPDGLACPAGSRRWRPPRRAFETKLLRIAGVQFVDLRTRLDRHAELMSLKGHASNTAIHFFSDYLD